MDIKDTEEYKSTKNLLNKITMKQETKEEIIKLAESFGFKLDYDKFDDKDYPGDSNGMRYLRFVSKDDSLDEKDLRWIWYKEDSTKDNILRGRHIIERLAKKKKILEFLKY